MLVRGYLHLLYTRAYQKLNKINKIKHVIKKEIANE